MGCQQSASEKEAQNFNQELSFRYKNVKSLLESLKSLQKAVTAEVAVMQKLPDTFTNVGEGYTAVNACLKHSGSNSVATSTVPDYRATDSRGGATKLNRQLAEVLCEEGGELGVAMRQIKEDEFPKFRREVTQKILDPIEIQIQALSAVHDKGKVTKEACNKYLSSKKRMEDEEQRVTRKGANVDEDANCNKLRGERDVMETAYKNHLKTFNSNYEEAMAGTQNTVSKTMRTLALLTVNYQNRILRILDDYANSAVESAGAQLVTPTRNTNTNASNNNNNNAISNANNNSAREPCQAPSPISFDNVDNSPHTVVNKHRRETSSLQDGADEGVSTRPHTPKGN